MLVLIRTLNIGEVFGVGGAFDEDVGGETDTREYHFANEAIGTISVLAVYSTFDNTRISISYNTPNRPYPPSTSRNQSRFSVGVHVRHVPSCVITRKDTTESAKWCSRMPCALTDAVPPTVCNAIGLHCIRSFLARVNVFDNIFPLCTRLHTEYIGTSEIHFA